MNTKVRWVKHWAGTFNLLYDTLLGFHNTALLKKAIGIDLNPARYIYRKGYTFAYFDEANYKAFGSELGKRVTARPELAKEWARNIIDTTDRNMDFMKAKLESDITSADYAAFVELFNEYSTWHRPVKVVVDFLPETVLSEVLPALREGRVHAEPVYEYHESLIRSWTNRIAQRTCHT